MVKYIVLRPVAVLTICLALLLLGIFSISAIPVSLLPDIEAPKITVITNHSGYSARDVENNITKELRQAFTQLNGLQDMQTESFDGLSRIDLIFEHGEDINLFYTKVNEKIDLAMNRLPNSVDKPYTIKSGVTDVPVVQLLITDSDSSSDFFKVSQLCEAIIKKKLEQLESVAFVDISGVIKKEVIVEIKKNEIENFGLSLEAVAQALRDNNVSASSFKLQEGGYQYLYELSSKLEDIESIKKIHLKVDDRLILMEDIADVSIKKNENQGTITQGDKPGIVFSIRKKNNS
jgi:multidrug efflux pump subunit AcrB